MTGLEAPLLGIILAASTTADVVTTRQALSSCSTCREGNPIMRPFARSTVALTAVQAGANYGLFRATLRYRDRHRKSWWIPLAGIIAVHTFAAWHNSKAPTDRELDALRARLDALERARGLR